ncbi:MAG TPA: SDR family oxidoreductase [Actinomycetes bacterium]|nr:SDR family oxidoreductase [Actinomycetes bacterium]
MARDDARRARHRHQPRLGRELARQLALRGDDVVLTARDLGKAERVAAALPGRERVLARRLDVTDPASVEQVATDLNSHCGRLDVLVNNAAIHYDTWQRATTADLQVVRSRWRSICWAPGRPASSCCRCYASTGAVFLASDSAAWLTGVTMDVAGGYS